jgi:hypothetical protein
MMVLTEGDNCPEDGCTGILEYPPVENCYCHVCPPCAACMNNKLTCTECGWEDEDGNDY